MLTWLTKELAYYYKLSVFIYSKWRFNTQPTTNHLHIKVSKITTRNLQRQAVVDSTTNWNL